MKVQIYRLDKSVPLPEYKTNGSVAFDMHVQETFTIQPGEIKLIPTGLVIKTPENYALVLASRSSTPIKRGLDIANSIGIIDQDYCGPTDEIKIQIRNFSKETVTIEKGERIAQAMFVRVDKVDFEEIEKIEDESRGGFGSTGK